MDKRKAMILAALYRGAVAEDVGGGMWVVVIPVEAGGVAVLSWDACCKFATREAWEAGEECTDVIDLA